VRGHGEHADDREYILNADKLPLIHSVVAEGVTQYGMQTFDQSVLALLREGVITEEEALKNCNNPNELALKLKGIASASDRTWQPVDAVTSDSEAAAGGVKKAAGKPEWMSRD